MYTLTSDGWKCFIIRKIISEEDIFAMMEE